MILIISNGDKNETLYTIPSLIKFFNEKKIKILIVNDTMDIKKIIKNKSKIKGVILSGGNLRITSEICMNKIIKNIFPILELNVPILGICLGFQILGVIYGGELSKFPKFRNYNQSLEIKKNKLFKNLDNPVKFRQMHNDYLKTISPLFKIIATSNNGKIIQAFKHKTKEIYGVQFHPEISGKNGEILLNNFLDII